MKNRGVIAKIPAYHSQSSRTKKKEKSQRQGYIETKQNQETQAKGLEAVMVYIELMCPEAAHPQNTCNHQGHRSDAYSGN